jgi:hypothetical protein
MKIESESTGSVNWRHLREFLIERETTITANPERSSPLIKSLILKRYSAIKGQKDLSSQARA